MNSKLQTLLPKDHQSLRFTPLSDFSFARSQLLAPIAAWEIADLAAEYPIVFSNTQGPCVLLGVQASQNAFVSDAGQWRGRYVPAALRLYPFFLSPPKTALDQTHAVLFDPEAPHFGQQNGQPLFDAASAPSELMKTVAENLKHFHEGRQAALQMAKAIQQAGLISESDLVISLGGHSGVKLGGAHGLNDKTLNTLGEAAYLGLRQAMPLIHGHFISLANLKRGALVEVLRLQQAH
jgi:hypothetical protein